MALRDAAHRFATPRVGGLAEGPRQVVGLRVFGLFAMLAIAATSAATAPHPGLSGRGALVSLALAAFVVGWSGVLPWWNHDPRRRAALLVLAAVASASLGALQDNGIWVGGIYAVSTVAVMRLERRQAIVVVLVALAAMAGAVVATSDAPVVTFLGLALGIVPWLLVMGLVRRLREGQLRSERLVSELEASREAQARDAAAAERGRLARDMHDVLAHSLSALALQLEGARLLARDHGADPEVTRAIERAHHLTRTGLEDARRTIAALRGDELPGPERLPALVEAFREQTGLDVRVEVEGEPVDLGSEVRLALYRTAQEALTNVQRHASAERVDVRLAYGPDGTTLVVEDRARAAVPVAGPSPDPVASAGYGLTGMRERAELLGGRLRTARTAEGFCVELWLPR